MNNKDKPAKHGLNFRSLDSSRQFCPYIYYTVPYTGKPVEVTESHIKDTLTFVKRIAQGYEQYDYSWQVHSLHINCIGSLNSNRKGLPKEIKETKVREENSWISCKSDKGEVTLNLYVVKTKSNAMRDVLLLQTTNPVNYVTQGDKKAS